MSDKRTVLSCDPITIVIIVILLLFGGGVGGYVIRGEVAPKTVVNNIEQTQIQMQSQLQSTVNVIDGKNVKTVDLQIDGMTNVSVYISTNGVTNK